MSTSVPRWPASTPGERLRFPNDGATFQNRERRLPKQPAGYYKEYVHPTPGLSGPGPQRIVMGQQGETYYTPDHYRTFQRVDRHEGTGDRGQESGVRNQWPGAAIASSLVVRIPRGIRSKEKLLAILADKLRFPRYFGQTGTPSKSASAICRGCRPGSRS